MSASKRDCASGPLPGSEPPAAGGFSASDNPGWTPQHQRWWTEFTVTVTLVLAACAGTFVALCFNDWSRLVAVLGVV